MLSEEEKENHRKIVFLSPLGTLRNNFKFERKRKLMREAFQVEELNQFLLLYSFHAG